MSQARRNWLLAVILILLVVVPLAYRGWVAEGTEWGGADMQGVAAVEELAGEDFEPWFEPIFSPNDLERYLFGLQALLGTLFVAGIVGWILGPLSCPAWNGKRNRYGDCRCALRHRRGIGYRAVLRGDGIWRASGDDFRLARHWSRALGVLHRLSLGPARRGRNEHTVISGRHRSARAWT